MEQMTACRVPARCRGNSLETAREVERVEAVATEAEAGERLDRVLPELKVGLSRSFVQHLIEVGLARVNDQATKPSYRVKAGDRLTILVPPPQAIDLAPEAIPLSVVYEDGNILVVDKPAGMVVHPAPGHYSGTLVNAILAHEPQLEINGSIRPGIVHRLDKDTSGLLVVAKNDQAKDDLVAQMKAGQILKQYLTLVEGHLRTRQGVIDAPIGRDPRNRKRMAVIPGGRPARTHYEVLEEVGTYSLVKVRLETGRTHQIRVHFAYVGHPVVGDPVYGRKPRGIGLERQFLHSYKLGLSLPVSGEYREFTSGLPPDLRNVLDHLKAGGR